MDRIIKIIRRPWVRIGGALALGGLTTLLFFQKIDRLKGEMRAQVEFSSVLVAKRFIPAGKIIKKKIAGSYILNLSHNG